MTRRFLTKSESESLNNLMPGMQLFQIGSKLKSALDALGAVGLSYYLDPTNGNDNNDGLSPETAVKTLSVGYGLLRDGYNDVLYYIPGSGSISLASAFTWSKSYAHFIGLCAPVTVGQRCRIFQTASATGVRALITFSGTGCIVKNIYIFHGVNDATSLICAKVTGSRNYFENVHFAGIGHATMSAPGSASLKIDGGSENSFIGCSIGLDTIVRDADATEIWFDSAATRNLFQDCIIFGYTGAAGYSLVTVEDGTALDRWTRFKNCLFMTDSENRAITMTTAFNIKAAISQGKIIIENSKLITDGASGSGEWDSNNRGLIWMDNVAPTASAAGGIMTKQ